MKKLAILSLLPLLLTGCSLMDSISGDDNKQKGEEDNYRYQLSILNTLDSNSTFFNPFTIYKGEEPFQIEYKVEKIKYIEVQQSESVWVGQDVETTDITSKVEDEIKWNISKENVISINKGKVSILGSGEVSTYFTYKNNTSNSIYFRSIIPSTKDIEIEQETIELTLDETHEVKYTLTPSDATCNIEDRSYGVFNFSNNIITPTKVGEGSITFVYLMENTEENSKDKYIWKSKEVNVKVTGETRSPYFTFNGEKVKSGIIKFAKNRYDSLDLVAHGISAFGYDGEDITTGITISGDYDLTKSGTYTLSLNVIAPNGYQASFELKLIIYEYDVEKYQHSFTIDDAFSYEMKVTTDKESGKSSFTKINYQVTFTKKKLDFLKGNMYINITAKADRTKQYNGGTLTERIEKKDTHHSMFDDLNMQSMALARTTFTISGSFYMDDDHNPCKYDSLTWSYEVSFIGEAYNAIYY